MSEEPCFARKPCLTPPRHPFPHHQAEACAPETIETTSFEPQTSTPTLEPHGRESTLIAQVSSSQNSPILSVACGSRCDAFATCSRDGTVRVWDLSDFGVVAEASDRPQGSVRGGLALFLCWLGEEAIVTGWSDCSVRYLPLFVIACARKRWLSLPCADCRKRPSSVAGRFLARKSRTKTIHHQSILIIYQITASSVDDLARVRHSGSSAGGVGWFSENFYRGSLLYLRRRHQMPRRRDWCSALGDPECSPCPSYLLCGAL